jgi:phenylacetic acid degradation operon negative regulatory protein
MPGVWVAPSAAPLPAIAEGAIRLEVSAEGVMGRRLVEASWSLERTAESYREFIKTFAPLESWIGGADKISTADAMLARVLLIHHYRRAILRDPLLPAALLPPAWPAADARRLCARLYQALLPASESWLDACGESVTGPLPPPGPELDRRFSDVQRNMLQK